MKLILALFVGTLPLLAQAEGFAGSYAGATLGYAEAVSKGTGYNTATSSRNGWTHRIEPDGASFGLLGGRNWVLPNQLLFGLELDVEGRNGSDRDEQKLNGLSVARYPVEKAAETTASVRGRLGYVVGQKALVYGTLGYAAAKVKHTYEDRLLATSESSTAWHHGWTVGLGGEVLLANNLSARLEYRYADYGKRKVEVDMWREYYKERFSEQSLRAAIVYLF